MKEMMFPQFIIKYRFHWCGSCEQYGDTKEETIIRSDGKIIVRKYDHLGPAGHYRIVNRAEGSADIDIIQNLYHDLLEVISNHTGLPPKLMDADAEIVLEESGLKISADAAMTDGKNDCLKLMDKFVKHTDLRQKYDLHE